MARPSSSRQSAGEAQPYAAAPMLRGAVPTDEDIESPTRRLRLELERNWDAPKELRWSARRRLGFIVLADLMLWASLVWAARALHQLT